MRVLKQYLWYRCSGEWFSNIYHTFYLVRSPDFLMSCYISEALCTHAWTICLSLYIMLFHHLLKLSELFPRQILFSDVPNHPYEGQNKGKVSLPLPPFYRRKKNSFITMKPKHLCSWWCCHEIYSHEVCLTKTKFEISGWFLSPKYVTKKTEKSEDLW